MFVSWGPKPFKQWPRFSVIPVIVEGLQVGILIPEEKMPQKKKIILVRLVRV